MKIFSLVAAATLAILPQSALAWGTNGHRVTGKIADSHIAEKTRAAITGILSVKSIAEASTWPDFMRSDPSGFWRDETPPWHYVTVPPGETYATAKKPTDNEGKPVGDAVTEEERQQWTDINPQTWIAENIVMRDRIYPFDPDNPPNPEYPAIPNLSYDYIYKHTADMNLRLKQGGVRLAAYLDHLFAE
ncbi:S1/P1 nuclease [Parasphingorhabdus halotolerans]|uniref:S1/P1 Nuclease n=1 Tax=Parasphingorhabdus halotolerans TaxID=2725558 RepID=A0A6H2DL28_9SPHN|nr:S1/P1 nuclease [Parasphingorhabdus halotolerans]QJB68847.1 hypothetical protein HF685_05775 [Parasphingorhabdus halotolerans]